MCWFWGGLWTAFREVVRCATYTPSPRFGRGERLHAQLCPRGLEVTSSELRSSLTIHEQKHNEVAATLFDQEFTHNGLGPSLLAQDPRTASTELRSSPKNSHTTGSELCSSPTIQKWQSQSSTFQGSNLQYFQEHNRSPQKELQCFWQKGWKASAIARAKARPLRNQVTRESHEAKRKVRLLWKFTLTTKT